MPSSSKEEKLSFFESLYASREADAHQICKNLFLGTASAAEDKGAMQKRGIGYVLLVHPMLPEKHPKHFKYQRLPLLDEPAANLLEMLPTAFAFFGQARSTGKAMFVHCMKGISRSSSVVIAYLMVDRGMSFDEAWKMCEEKRPVVYPNVGFQLQLRHLEKLMGIAGLAGSAAEGVDWNEKVQRLKKVVPKGSLDRLQAEEEAALAGPCLSIREEISESMHAAFTEVEALTNRTFTQPQLLQKRELWKRHGLYFENLHKYGALPRDKALLDRARAVSERLGSLPKTFSDAVKGVKLATAVAKEIDSWLQVTEPKLLKEQTEEKSKEPAEKKQEKKETSPYLAVPDWVLHGVKDGGSKEEEEEEDSSSEEDVGKAKHKKKDKKKDKKEKKKDAKKLKKAKKAEAMASEMQRVADEAEKAAKEATRVAELAAKQANRVEESIREAEAREAEAADAQKGSGEKRSRPEARKSNRSDDSEDDRGREKKRKRRD